MRQMHTVPPDKVVVFFIGGAADKVSYYGLGPLNLMEKVKNIFGQRMQLYQEKELYEAFYCGFDEVKGEKNIQRHILSKLPHSHVSIYIVGLSLGGWNGAHLSQRLVEKGYCVEMLITLDPVGKGLIVSWISAIYRGEPQPKSAFWINVRAIPRRFDISDSMAWAGAKWLMLAGPNVNSYVITNHRYADKMFFSPLEGGKSAADWLTESIALKCRGRLTE